MVARATAACKARKMGYWSHWASESCGQDIAGHPRSAPFDDSAATRVPIRRILVCENHTTGVRNLQ